MNITGIRVKTEQAIDSLIASIAIKGEANRVFYQTTLGFIVAYIMQRVETNIGILSQDNGDFVKLESFFVAVKKERPSYVNRLMWHLKNNTPFVASEFKGAWTFVVNAAKAAEGRKAVKPAFTQSSFLKATNPAPTPTPKASVAKFQKEVAALVDRYVNKLYTETGGKVMADQLDKIVTNGSKKYAL